MDTNNSFRTRAKQALYFYAGIGQGVVDTVKGIAKLAVFPYVKGYEGLKQGSEFIAHPQQKAEAEFQRSKEDYQNLKRLWNNPREEISNKKELAKANLQHVWQEGTKDFRDANPNKRARAWGELTFDIASLLYGAGEVKGALVVEKEAVALSKLEKIEETSLQIERKFLIHEGKQGKHVLGHNNYDYPNSILTHPNPQALVDKFAGTGKGMWSGKVFPEAGYKERIDFGEVIGKFIDRDTSVATDTTIGSIEYSKTNVHIVPRRP